MTTQTRTAAHPNNTKDIRSTGSVTRKLPIGGNNNAAKTRIAATPPRMADARPHSNPAAITTTMKKAGASNLSSEPLRTRDRHTAPQAQNAVVHRVLTFINRAAAIVAYVGQVVSAFYSYELRTI